MGSIFPWRTVVVTPPVKTNLTTLENVLKELELENAPQATKDWLEEQVATASDDAVKYCDRQFALQTVTDQFSGNAFSRIGSIFLSLTPVVAISEASLAGALVDASLYNVNPETGEVRYFASDGGPGYWIGSPVVVTYQGGYDLVGTLPRDLERAVVALVKHRYFSRKRDPSVKSESVPDILSQEYWVGQQGDDGALPPDVKSVFDRYRRRTC